MDGVSFSRTRWKTFFDFPYAKHYIVFMTYYRFNPDNGFHQETCEFDDCKKRAIGYRGARATNRTYLCKEHFDYGVAVDGVSSFEIRTERRI